MVFEAIPLYYMLIFGLLLFLFFILFMAVCGNTMALKALSKCGIPIYQERHENTPASCEVVPRVKWGMNRVKKVIVVY